MATKLQDLPAASSVADTDIAYEVATPGTAPTDKKVPFSVVKAYIKADTNIADAISKKHSAAGQINQATPAEISALTDKATPVDADVILAEDSETTPTAFEKIKITLAHLKSYLKTYFDTLYAPIGGGGGVTYSVQDKTDDYPVVVADLGVGSTLTMDNASPKTFTLPTLSAGDLGKQITFVKKGAGKLTIQAGTGQKIADSGAAGTIYDTEAGETYASITLVATTTTQWNIVGFDGTWTTTDPLA